MLMAGISTMKTVSRMPAARSAAVGVLAASMKLETLRLAAVIQASSSARVVACPALVLRISMTLPPASMMSWPWLPAVAPCAARSRAAFLQPGQKNSDTCTRAYLAPVARRSSSEYASVQG